MPETRNDNQVIIGQSKHHQTGAYTVWVSLNGDDVTTVGAWRAEAHAIQAMQETGEAYHQLTNVMGNAAPEQAETVGVDQWGAFLDRMNQQSGIKATPFSQEQLAEIGRNIEALMKHHPTTQETPDGFARVLFYTPQTLAELTGLEMPRVRLAPMKLPPRKKR